jgi:PAS domain S-box-containing protein
MKNEDTLAERMNDARENLDRMVRLSDDGKASLITQDALHELSNVLEELHVASEELQVQNEELAQVTRLVEAEQKRYQELFEFAPDGYLTTDMQGTISEANQALAQMLHVQSKFLIGKPLSVFVDPESRRKLFALLAKLQNGELKRVDDCEFTLTPRDGAFLFASVTIAIDEHSRPRELRMLIRDIGERKKTAAILAEKVRELARVNSELELMASAAAHDLSEPLRVMATFAALLKEKPLDEEGRKMLSFIQDSADQAINRIQALLAYSSIGKKQRPFELVDINEVVQSVVQVTPLLHEIGGKVTTEDLPSLFGDRELLRSLFHNLLDNAIKFRGQRPLHIHIAGRKQDNEWEISFSDNGIGFDNKYVDRMFAIFKRLHDPAKYAGTGIGLAICKKIVECHHGQIRAESSTEGARFVFTIPARQS